MRHRLLLLVVAGLAALTSSAVTADGVRLKELGRFDGAREHDLIGYGIVGGLAGTGDSAANRATIQSIVNTLIEFGVNADIRDVRSRNAAAVIVTAVLPPFMEPGQRIDISVSSLGDARSLAGGTLFLTPLYGPDERLYALAQGQLTVGGYAFSSFDSSYQKNHPTVGSISNGALVERALDVEVIDDQGDLKFVLHQPDFVTVQKIVERASALPGNVQVTPVHAGLVKFSMDPNSPASARFALMSQIQQLSVQPDTVARVVINERTGTVVAGGNVTVGEVTISHENIRVEIDTRYLISQPTDLFLGRGNDGVTSVVVPDTEISVTEEGGGAVQLSRGTSVAELIDALAAVDASTRDVIAILQSIKRAGALQAEIVVE
ncbi:MAG: flagellar basal body P-ring protein FlgI [Pseudomonadota bacterium]